MRESDDAAVPYGRQVFFKYHESSGPHHGAHLLRSILRKARIDLCHDLVLIRVMDHRIASPLQYSVHFGKVARDQIGIQVNKAAETKDKVESGILDAGKVAAIVLDECDIWAIKAAPYLL